MNTTSLSADAGAKYAWAEYLDCMEGVPGDVVSLTKTKPLAKEKQSIALGLLVCLGLTVVSMSTSYIPVWPFTVMDPNHPGKSSHPLEPVMVSIVLGMLLSNMWALPKSFHAGVKYSVKKLLPLGIILLGAKLNFYQILKLGGVSIAMGLFEVGLALLLMFVFVRWLKLSGKLGTLLGIGTAICGGTAIVATAPVIEAEESDVVFGVATVTLLGLIGMFLLPVLAHVMNMTQTAFGVWAGLAIHQTPQVVAAGFSYGDQAGQTATVTKMFRVCLLAPVVFVTGLIYARQKAKLQGAGEKKNINYFSLFPKFVFGFLALALLRTMGWLPDFTGHWAPGAVAINPGHSDFSFSLADVAQSGATFFIVMSMAGVGLETKFNAMRQTGLRPFFAAAASAVIIALVVLCLIRFLGNNYFQ